MTTWLMIGSSPSVLQTLPQFADFDGMTITCNSGICLWPVPDVYFAIDQFASVMWHDEAANAQRMGTKLVSVLRGPKAAKQRKIEHYDLFLDLAHKTNPSRTDYGEFRYSGPLCVEHACHNGAEVIHLIGMDGYRHGNDYWDADKALGRRNLPNMKSTHTEAHIQPRMQQLADVWHDVQFIQHGDPCYVVNADNWEVRAACLQ